MEVKVSLSESGIKITGAYKTEYIYENAQNGDYTFHSSKIYGLVGSEGSGNRALSYLLTGWSKSNNISITIDGQSVSPKELRNISCYIGHQHYYDLFPFHKHLSVKKAIENGIKKSRNSSQTFQTIKEKFDLTDERENRRFKYIGNEHWRASLAVGYAYGKSIYCAGFLDSAMWEKYYSVMLAKWLNILKDDGAIVLIPTDDEKCLGNFVDEVYYF